jgi:hypothetical protein
VTDTHVDLKHLGKIKETRKEIMDTLRAVAKVMQHPAHRQVVMDLVTKLGPTKDPQYDILPAQPNGFALKHTSIPKNGAAHLRTQCEYQVITMMITYFWVFCQTGDMQDLRSVMRYKGWLNRYADAPYRFEVCGDVRKGFWLCDTNVLKEGENPTLPKWLKADKGETV